jgi:hypothetical protein
MELRLQSAAMIRRELVTGLQDPAFTGKGLHDTDFAFMGRQWVFGGYF